MSTVKLKSAESFNKANMDLLKETLPERPSEYIPTLDGWRAIAIGAVLLSHGLSSHHQVFGQDSLGKRVAHVVLDHAGNAGVLLFFSISGFIICTRLLNQESRNGGISLRDFYIRRTFRILPPAFAYLLVVAILFLIGVLPRIIDTQFSWNDWFGAVFFFNNYNMQRHTAVLDHFWSLAVEEQFYLFWPAMLLWLGSKKAGRAALFVSVCAIFWRVWCLSSTPAVGHSLLLKRTDIRLDSFMLPCVAAIWLVSSRREQIIRYAANPVIQAVTITSLLVISFVPKILRTGLFLERALVPLLITALVVTTVTRPWGWLGRFLELRVLRWIGRLSYSIYLWQEIVINRPASVNSDFAHMASLFLLRLPVVVALAMISYRWIEVPLIRTGRKLARQIAMRSSAMTIVDMTVQDSVLK